MIKIGRGKNENEDRQSADEKEAEISPYSVAPVAQREHIGFFEEWLENTELSESTKRTFLLRLAEEDPELLVRRLKERPER